MYIENKCLGSESWGSHNHTSKPLGNDIEVYRMYQQTNRLTRETREERQWEIKPDVCGKLQQLGKLWLCEKQQMVKMDTCHLFMQHLHFFFTFTFILYTWMCSSFYFISSFFFNQKLILTHIFTKQSVLGFVSPLLWQACETFDLFSCYSFFKYDCVHKIIVILF